MPNRKLAPASRRRGRVRQSTTRFTKRREQADMLLCAEVLYSAGLLWLHILVFRHEIEAICFVFQTSVTWSGPRYSGTSHWLRGSFAQRRIPVQTRPRAWVYFDGLTGLQLLKVRAADSNLVLPNVPGNWIEIAA